MENNKEEDSLKEFWERESERCYSSETKLRTDAIRVHLGLFFWERGGKKFVENYHTWTVPFLIRTDIYNIEASAKSFLKSGALKKANCSDDSVSWICSANARDFLDCLDCFGEEKVKELIKRLNENGK